MNNKKLSFCGMMTALSAVLAMLMNVLPFNTLFLLVLMSLIICITVQSSGMVMGLCTAAATTVVMIFVTGRLDVAILYLLVFGTYPVAKYLIESKVKHFRIGDVLKVIYYFAVSSAYAAFVFFMLGDIRNELKEIHEYLPYAIPLAGTAAMWIYDWVLTKIIWAYNKRFGKYFV